MSLDLSLQAEAEIWAEAEYHCPPMTSIDHLETVRIVPSVLGHGFRREIELTPGFDLCIFHQTLYGVTLRVPANEHLVQFVVNLSGVTDSGDFLAINPEQGYVGGSGIQRSHQVFLPQSQPQIGVNIHLEPQLVRQFFATPAGELPAEWQPLMQTDQPQRVFSPKTTLAMRSVVQQIIGCPFVGMTRRLYLQGKVFELMALQMAAIECNTELATHADLKLSTIAQIHYAAEILRSQLEHPPSQIQLAQQVGVSDRTLQKGFRAVFGVTPFVYLTQQRMTSAKRLLQRGDRTVAEVAAIVGYANPAQFAVAFKRQLGVSPHECFSPRKAESNSVLE